MDEKKIQTKRLFGIALRGWTPRGDWKQPVEAVRATWYAAYDKHGYPPICERVQNWSVGHLCNILYGIATMEAAPSDEQLNIYAQGIWRLFLEWNIHDELEQREKDNAPS